MSILRHTFLLLCTSALTGCMFIQQEEPDEPQVCPAIYELCPEGSAAVEACAPGARCVQINECGGDPTICQYNDDPITCDALPVCGESSYEVESCEAGDELCSARTVCGHTIYCKRDDNVNCLAIPVCPEGTYQIEGNACPPDTSCTRVSLCGTTILCAKGGVHHCEAYPSCGEDEVEVRDCTNSGIPCRYVELCGYTIACQKDLIQCTAVPVCEKGYRQVPDCANNGRPCEYVTICGSTIACEEELANCQAFPTCPAGTQQVTSCDPNDPTCSQVTLCGHTISCQSGASHCAPQRVSGDGFCDAFFGYGWNGRFCEGISGCRCSGADCGNLYMSKEQCESAYATCTP
jgi:hypothetical protein